jgi:hypothetical protein
MFPKKNVKKILVSVWTQSCPRGSQSKRMDPSPSVWTPLRPHGPHCVHEDPSLSVRTELELVWTGLCPRGKLSTCAIYIAGFYTQTVQCLKVRNAPKASIYDVVHGSIWIFGCVHSIMSHLRRWQCLFHNAFHFSIRD